MSLYPDMETSASAATSNVSVLKSIMNGCLFAENVKLLIKDEDCKLKYVTYNKLYTIAWS